MDKDLSGRATLTAISAVLVLLVAAAATVIVGGGTRYAYPHVAYIPIITAAFFFGLRGGMVACLAAGLVIGPFMPLDVDAWTFQSTENWLSRTGFFTLVGAFSGIACDSLREQLQLLRRSAHYDYHTGLPNRVMCEEELDLLLRTHKNGPVTALCVGIGGLEGLSTALGHDYASGLHAAMATRLQGLLQGQAQLYSFGRGLFAILSLAPAESVAGLGARLASSLQERFEIDGIPVLPGGHAGIATSDETGSAAEALLRECVAAFHNAEAKRQLVAQFDGSSDRDRKARIRLLPDLQEALRTGAGISLHYQPLLDLRTGTCAGAEALARWQHPEFGNVPPAQFIEAAEQTALMRPLTRLVLRLALTQLSLWHDQGLDIRLSVNISVRDLEDEGFPRVVADLLAEFDVSATKLTLEVTETALISSAGDVLETLGALRKMGTSIALDDFGVGQSSLSYLANLPADYLKLDRTFARDLHDNPRAKAVISAAIQAAHALGQVVVAEGIERPEVVEALHQASCDFGQGYLFSSPVPEPEFRAWLAEHQLRLAQNRLFRSPPLPSNDSCMRPSPDRARTNRTSRAGRSRQH